MKWCGGRQSSNVKDHSGRSAGSRGRIMAGGGIDTIVIAVLFFLFSGGDLNSATDILGGEQAANYQTENMASGKYTEEEEFSAVVFGHLEDYWNGVFEAEQTTYQNPKLVLFTGSAQSAYGNATSQVGPFYCPADQNVCLDLSFATELSQKYGASGDSAVTYVIAHEIDHHVQNELGITQQFDKTRQQVSEKEYNQCSVRLELQAGYLAGTFAKYLQGKTYNGQLILEAGDIEGAITAANAIGDDTLQKEYQGYVIPGSSTHRTSKQRVEWFNRGSKYGNLEYGDTFNGKNLDLAYRP